MYSRNSRDSKAFYQARKDQDRGVRVEDRRGVRVDDRRGVRVDDRRGVRVDDRRGVRVEDRRGVRVEDRRGVRVDDRRGVRVEDRRGVQEVFQSQVVPTADQIHNLVKQVFEPYDPEDWSILDKRDQQIIHKIVYHTPLMDLSIRRVLQVSRFAETPSTVAFITDCIRRKFNSVTQ
jgi:hypothetical protein